MSVDKVTTIRLEGHVPSKKNGYRYTKKGGYVPPEVKAQLDALQLQAQMRWRAEGRSAPAHHPQITLMLVCDDGRGDADNQQTTILDVLKKAEVIRDDNRKALRSPLVVHWDIRPKQAEYTLVRIAEAA